MAADDDTKLVQEVVGFTHDPLGYAIYAYPWGVPGTPLENERIRKWQEGELAAIGKHLRNPATRFMPYRSAVASGHGIGKSALIGMICGWGLDTCEDTRIVLAANTEAQLRQKTMPEVTKWRNMSVTADWWTITSTAIFSRQPKHERSWRLDAATWSKNNTEAFAGLHNKGKRIIVLFDEGSGIDDKVWAVTQGALTDEDTEILWIVFGNPTKATGWFKECFGRLRHLWRTRHIDSREVEGTNRAYLQEMIDTYGEDSDMARVRVRGLFPRVSAYQFIASDVAQEAQKRPLQVQTLAPLIYGVDTARFGDDTSVLAKRRGRDARSLPWRKWTAAQTMGLGGSIKIAGDIAQDAMIERPDAIFVDAGGPNAGGVIDHLRALGIPNVFEVHFAGAGREAVWQGENRVKCWNKRAEMWVNMRGWLPSGCVPEDKDLEADLTGIEYGYAADGQSILMEKKEHMKDRGLASPDKADALALTFAEPVAMLQPGEDRWADRFRGGGRRDYDPLDQLR